LVKERLCLPLLFLPERKSAYRVKEYEASSMPSISDAKYPLNNWAGGWSAL